MCSVRNLFIVLLCLSLAGCGFSLRGNDVLTSKFSSLRIDSQQPNSEFSRLLIRRLETAAVNTALSPGDNVTNTVPVLSLGAEQLLVRPVSVNPRARAAQYELRLSVEVAMTLAANYVLEPESLVVERSYFEDIENIAGNQEEMELIASEMRRELVNQLMRRLAAVQI